ncbi:MAG: 23S rRNA (cytidine1920-2'-O)/16S rRNA (cytidine1409-2'-O)-methyltransferase [Arcobacteraceae bacterium]|jgi:23S rRNA (cytidine1920-2'-O)/16S rRNA (cytidine1409-2'-O)-methyltransferase
MRLDIYITKTYNIQSRNKASELIKSNKVFVNGKIIKKPSHILTGDEEIHITEKDFFVSRSAYKLKYFLEDNNIVVKDKIAIDIGSSTGGFTQILLNKDIKSVTCVDVGTNQLHSSMKNNEKIIIVENTDIRKFVSNTTYDLVTCDVSFISILNILNDIDRLSNHEIIILYKPQFEVGKEIKRDKNGVVLDLKAIQKERDNFLNETKKLKWKLLITNESKLAGKSGNIEELFYFSSLSK